MDSKILMTTNTNTLLTEKTTKRKRSRLMSSDEKILALVFLAVIIYLCVQCPSLMWFFGFLLLLKAMA